MALPEQQVPREDRSLGDLLKELSSEVSRLVRQEIELAKVETTAKARETARAAGLLVGAGVAGVILLGALTALLILALDVAMPAWAAALIAVGLWLVITGILALVGLQRYRRAQPLKPEQTVETIKEDVQWLKNPSR
jgi:uncharacterized membrane protein YqjE